VLWGTQEPREALSGATEIVAAARAARDPEEELDGHVLRLTHLLELGDGPGARQALADIDRLAGLLRQPLARLVASSRRSTLAALAGDFTEAARLARQAWETGVSASLPDAGAVYWGQLSGSTPASPSPTNSGWRRSCASWPPAPGCRWPTPAPWS
jgi:hypothetical protein